MKKTIIIDVTSKEQLQEIILQTCKDNPGKIIAAATTFGIATRIYVYDRQPRTDSRDTIETFQEDRGFWKDGKIIQPSKTWFDRYNFCPVSK